MKNKGLMRICDFMEYTAKMIIYTPVVASLALGFMFIFTFSLLILGADFEGFNFITCYIYMLPISFSWILYRLIMSKKRAIKKKIAKTA